MNEEGDVSRKQKKFEGQKGDIFKNLYFLEGESGKKRDEERKVRAQGREWERGCERVSMGEREDNTNSWAQNRTDYCPYSYM